MISATPDARIFVSSIAVDTFRQKYDPIVRTQAFGALMRCECTKGQFDQVSHALHDAGIPGDLLNDEAKVVDIAGHLMQMSLYLTARKH